jgi:hypothetical protein
MYVQLKFGFIMSHMQLHVMYVTSVVIALVHPS